MNNFYSHGQGPASSMLVRRGHSHAVTAYLRRGENGYGFVLVRVVKHSGPVPDVKDLIGPVFQHRRALRRLILARMRPAREDESDVFA